MGASAAVPSAAPLPTGADDSGGAPATPWHALPAADALLRLDSSAGGLSESEAAGRLARWGPNRLRATPPVSAWRSPAPP